MRVGHSDNIDPPTSVPVVLVHWNQVERLAATLQAFDGQGITVRPIVVDNGSVASERVHLAELLADRPDVLLVASETNTGFGPGANLGFRAARVSGDEEWIALAPHDALPAASTLRRMLDLIAAEEARREVRVGLACADVGDGHRPVMDPYFGGMTVAIDDVDAVPAVGRWEPVDYPHGTLMLARRACLEEIGLFDERYFAYCEEADLGARARAAGWEVGLTRGISVTNPTMRSGSPVVDYLMHRNTLLLVRDHSGRYHAFIRLCIAVGQLALGLAGRGRATLAWSPRGRIWGIRDFLLGRFGPPPAALFESPPA